MFEINEILCVFTKLRGWSLAVAHSCWTLEPTTR